MATFDLDSEAKKARLNFVGAPPGHGPQKLAQQMFVPALISAVPGAMGRHAPKKLVRETVGQRVADSAAGVAVDAGRRPGQQKLAQ